MIVGRHILVLCLLFVSLTGFSNPPIGFNFNEGEKNYCEEVSFYPNPVITVLHINNLQGIKTIIISDITGEQIKTFDNITTEKISFTTNDMVKGMYFITIFDINDNVSTKKLIKK